MRYERRLVPGQAPGESRFKTFTHSEAVISHKSYDTKRERFKLFHTIEPRDVGWSVLDVAVSPDGRDLVYSSWSDCLHSVRIREDGYDDLDVHQSLPLCPGDLQFCVFSISFSSDSR